ncbi:MAG: hypothetical protein AABZ09_01070, partial [Candidatus Binatota bacterium]
PPNLIHLLFDNQCYEASGATATATVTGTDAVALVKGAGYRHACWVKSPKVFREEFLKAWKRNEFSFIAARVEPGQPELPPIGVDEVENKYRFVRHIEATEKKGILGPSDHRRG